MDPISNMLISMKNGAMVSKETVVVPHSKIKLAILECLKRANFIDDVKALVKRDRPMIEITLRYVDGKSKISDVKRISKQSRRMYAGIRDIKSVKNGFGVTVFSTPKGILTDKEAKKEQVGGEVLFEIW